MKKSRLEEIRDIRLGKVARLRELGIDPYPARSKKDYSNSEITKNFDKYEGKVVTLTGRLMSWREHGNIAFGHIQDESGQIQIFIQKKLLLDTSKENQTLGFKDAMKLLDIGDFVQVSGEVGKTVRGEISLLPTEIKILTKSIRPLPEKWHGLKDIEERYRQRYVDLVVNVDVRKVFEARAKVVTLLRRYMDENEFVEVETPVLQSIYGGASAQPFVTHHNALDNDFYLRISDELYLKRLIVGGFNRVYEIAHVFRNEGIDRSHNPEFTMMEFYWAYSDYEHLMKYTEEMLSSIIEEVTGSMIVEYQGDKLDFTPPWPRKTFRELLVDHVGIDIDEVDTEEKLLNEIKSKKLKLDLDGVVGYGALCDNLYKEYVRPSLNQPMYLLDYPAAMIALAKKNEKDPRKISSFQLLVKGYEVLKAYNELNDPVDQKNRWLEEEKLGEKGLEDHMVIDEDYIRALEYGMPPTAGWGMGIDRFVSLITDQKTIKDTILFPTLRPEVKEVTKEEKKKKRKKNND